MRSGVYPFVIGLPAFPSLMMSSLPSLSFTSHTQPDPNWATPASTKAFLKASKEPHFSSIAFAKAPLGPSLLCGVKLKKPIGGIKL